MSAHRRPFAAFLRRKHRPTIVIHPAERITCRHGLTRCDHCRPLYQTGVAARNALMTPTRLMPTLEGRR